MEDEASPLRFLRRRLGLERRYTVVGSGLHSGKLQRGQFKLNLLPVASAYLDEGVEGARSHIEADPLSEEPGDLTVRPPFAAQLPDQFPVRFEFGAWRLGWKVGAF